MKRAKQLGFEILEKNQIKQFGGAHLKNSNAKTARPMPTKRSSHLVMRSLYAKGQKSFLNFETEIRRIINKQAARFGVKVYRFANGGNHLHMVILPRTRDAYIKFIRAMSGLIARLIMNCEKSRPNLIKFWEKRPYTRIVEWGRDFRGVCAYLTQNTLEALGFIEYQPRKPRYPKISSA